MSEPCPNCRAMRAHVEKLTSILDDVAPCDDNCDLGGVLAWVDPADLARMREMRHTWETALRRIASGESDPFAGDPGKWPSTIAALALGWVSDEAGGPLHPPGEAPPTEGPRLRALRGHRVLSMLIRLLAK